MASAYGETGVPPGYRVLLVEDDPLLARVASQQLESIGCTVAHVALDAEAAIAWVDGGGEIDLLLADIVMPGMNGVALALHINDRRPDIRVLLTTGYGAALVDEQSRHYRVIGKPWRSEEIAAEICGIAARPVLGA